MRAFTLNNLGQIQSITGIATYGYDGNGRRIKATKSGATDYTLYDRAGRLVYTEQGTTRTDYLSIGGHTVVELKKTGTTTTPTYLHPDLLGSPRKATTQAKALLWSEHYNPYGLKMNGVNQKIGYTGHAHDAESGYTYMQARFYDPLVGRFLSTDPIHFVDENPFSFNRYSYANNNPYTYRDPDGRIAETIWDFANISMGVASFAKNVGVGNYAGAAIDAVGVVVDVAATAAPVVPGGAASAIKASRAASALDAKGAEKYTVGAYNEIKGTAPGLDAHHVGQKGLMKDMVPGYDPATAPSVLVPKVGHTIKGPNGIVSRSMEGLATPRDVLARDIRELRRVYPDAPNSQLQQLIQMNKDAYPGSFAK